MVNDCTTICDSLQICNIIDTGPFIEALRDTIKVYFYYRHTLTTTLSRLFYLF